MIIEFFGLSNTGKSYLKRKLDEKGFSVVRTQEIPRLTKSLHLIKYLVRHPLNAISLFYILNTNHLAMNKLSFNKRLKILKMRNSYLAFVLSKHAKFKNKQEKRFIDEFSFQSLFMILQNKSSEKDIEKIIKKLPRSDLLILFEKDREKRYKAYKKVHPHKPNATLLPTSWIDKSYALSLMENMEHNFEIIKKVIVKNYTADKTALSEINTLKLPKSYIKDVRLSAYKLL